MLEQLTFFDIAVLLGALILVIRAFFRGFFTELFALTAVFLSIYLASTFYETVSSLFVDFIDSPWNWIISFLIIFVVVYLLVKLVDSLCSRVIDSLSLHKIDRALAIFLGLLEAFLLLTVLVVLIRKQNFFDFSSVLRGSFFVSLVDSVLPEILFFLY